MKSTKSGFVQFDIDKKELFSTGETVCKCCSGSGINPDYLEVNNILKAIDHLGHNCNGWFAKVFNSANTTAPYCLNCCGMKRVDWIQYARSNYNQDLVKSRKKMREWFLRDVHPFLDYVYFGEVFTPCGTENKYLHFDHERKYWVEVDGVNADGNTLRAAYKWLHKFKDDDYFDMSNIADVAFNNQELYSIEPELHLKAIKNELIFSKNFSIDRLLEIKNDVDLFWYDIKWLDRLEVDYEVQMELPTGFKFTWENILRKFGLPMEYLTTLEQES